MKRTAELPVPIWALAVGLPLSTFLLGEALSLFTVPLTTSNPWRELNLAFVPIVALGAAALLWGLLNKRERSLAEQGRTLPDSEEEFPLLLGSFVIAASVLLATMLAIAPDFFFGFASEDGPLEYTQFLVYTTTSLVWLSVVRRSAGKGRWLLPLAILGVAGFAFVAGEEISWGQRILGFDTPELLSGNEQEEANIHNLATPLFNVSYMVFALGALGIGHFLYPVKGFLREMWDLLRPSTAVFVVYSGAVGFHSGYMYRLCLFMISLSVLYYGYLFWTRRQIAWLIAAASILYVAGVSFVFEGGLRWWWYTIDEGREAFYGGALLVHALVVRGRLQAPEYVPAPVRETALL